MEVRQTHISAVFLAGDFVYKVKKPVAPGFLDFSTLENRRHYCEEEVRLNRRLAPGVYLGVVPVVRSGNGVALEGEGEAVEWAVKMVRLPEDATFLARLQRGEVGPELTAELARRIAAFHRTAEGGERVAAHGRFEAVAREVRAVVAKVSPQVGVTISQPDADRILARTEEELARHHALMDARAARGMTRDCHGDLHLDHVYHFPDREPPADLIAIDCIEFSERLRFLDPVADAAFPVMDLKFRGRPDLADVFADAYLSAAGDEEGRTLLPLYTAYRAAVRATVEGLMLAEPEIPEAERTRATEKARKHWQLALSELEPPAHPGQ